MKPRSLHTSPVTSLANGINDFMPNPHHNYLPREAIQQLNLIWHTAHVQDFLRLIADGVWGDLNDTKQVASYIQQV